MPNPKIGPDERAQAWKVFAESGPYPDAYEIYRNFTTRGTETSKAVSSDFDKFLGWYTKPDGYIEQRYKMLIGPHGPAIVKAWYVKEQK